MSIRRGLNLGYEVFLEWTGSEWQLNGQTVTPAQFARLEEILEVYSEAAEYAVAVLPAGIQADARKEVFRALVDNTMILWHPPRLEAWIDLDCGGAISVGDDGQIDYAHEGVLIQNVGNEWRDTLRAIVEFAQARAAGANLTIEEGLTILHAWIRRVGVLET